MNIEYAFTTTADPDNPNQQQPGITILDHRLWGVPAKDIVFFSYGLAFTGPLISKETMSSTITLLAEEFTEGEKVILTVQTYPTY